MIWFQFATPDRICLCLGLGRKWIAASQRSIPTHCVTCVQHHVLWCAAVMLHVVAAGGLHLPFQNTFTFWWCIIFCEHYTSTHVAILHAGY